MLGYLSNHIDDFIKVNLVKNLSLTYLKVLQTSSVETNSTPSHGDVFDSLSSLNDHLLNSSYISGYTPTARDLDVLDRLSSASQPANLSAFPHALRWYCHMSSFDSQERLEIRKQSGTGSGINVLNSEKVRVF